MWEWHVSVCIKNENFLNSVGNIVPREENWIKNGCKPYIKYTFSMGNIKAILSAFACDNFVYSIRFIFFLKFHNNVLKYYIYLIILDEFSLYKWSSSS